MSSDCVIRALDFLRAPRKIVRKMLYCTVLIVLFSCTIFSSSQEVPYSQLFNISELDSRGSSNIPSEYGDTESDLWLISKDDPIPVSLNQRWPTDEAISRRIIELPPNDYRSHLSDSASSDNHSERSARQQSSVPYVFSAPVLSYDRVLTAENRRQNQEENQLNVQSPNAVLVQLPVQLTEGLWERPQSQVLEQLFVQRRQNSNIGPVNIETGDVISSEKQEDVQSIYAPSRQFTSRLPANEFTQQRQSDYPVEQYNQESHQNVSPVTYISGAVNISSVVNPLNYVIPESRADGILLRNSGRNFPIASEDESLRRVHGTIATDEANSKVHEFDGVLTSEDIELLERLGIFSSLILEPIEVENISDAFYPEEKPQREYERQSESIDHSRQSYFINSENRVNLSDVILLSIPRFTAAEYHTNVPENVGSDHSFRPYYLESQSSNVTDVNLKSNGSSDSRNGTSLDEKQILEFLQLLSVNSREIFNGPTELPPSLETEIVKNGQNENRTSNITEHRISNKAGADELNIDTTKQLEVTTPSTIIVKSFNDTSSRASEQNGFVSIPTVRNGRIQPRLLEKLTPKENEVVEKLMEKAISMSESKFDLLKKLQIRPKPYFFGFKQDDGNGTLQHRNETSDASGIVKGNYGYRDAMGVYRNVSYIADEKGFHAVVKTNEPGTVSHSTADVVFMAETPPLAALVKMMAYRRPKVALNDTAKP